MTVNQHNPADTALLAARQRPSVVMSIVLVLAVGIGVGAFALWFARPAGSLVLLVIAGLAVIGVFTLLGAAAGLIRLSGEEDAVMIARRAFAGADMGLMVTDRSGHLLTANRATTQLLGETRSGEPVAIDDAFSSDPQAAECIFRLLRAAERRESRQEEVRVRMLDGKARATRWLRIAVRPLPRREVGLPDDGAVLWQLADITQERARSSEAVRALEARLSQFEHLPLGLMEIAPGGRVQEINTTLAGWLGTTSAELVERDVRVGELLGHGGEAIIRAAMGEAHGEWAPVETDLVDAGGKVTPVEMMLLPTDGRERGGVLALVLPRRERREASPVRESSLEGRLARLLQSAPFGIATIARDGRIVTANASFASMFRFDGAPEIGSIRDVIGRIVDADGKGALAHAIEATLGGKLQREPVEVTVGPEGKFTRRLVLSPLTGGHADGEAAVVYVIDATDQKALELMYAQSTKMEAVGKLAGGIAHDFNNVLTAIIGGSELLLQTHRPTDAAYKDINNIKQNANRAAGMVRQLLAFSRRQTLQPEVLALGDVISDTGAALLRKLIGERVDLRIVSERDLWLVKADRTQLDQVLLNLAVNAKDAMPEGGQLTIETRNVDDRSSRLLKVKGMPPGDYVEIAVEDSGHGMPPDVLAKIFEPFFSTKEVGKGTGLGLSTVYGIVKQTGGYVFAESTLGKGTVFRIYLPRHLPSPAEAAEPKRSGPKEPPRDLTGSGRVLVVEDEDSVRSFAVRALQRQGYEVLQATTGREALDLVAREKVPIDIVVSDVVMPEMDGPSMLKELRGRIPDMKVIFVSGYPDDAFDRNLDPGQHYAFLPKPFTLAQLAAKVKEELQR